MNIRKLLTTILCLFLLIGCTKKSEDINNEEQVQADYGLREYEHYEIGDYEQRCNDLLEKANNGIFDKQLYQSLYDEALKVDELSAVAYVKYCENVNDEALTKENSYIEEVCEKVMNYLATTAHELTESKVSEEFKAYINNDTSYQAYVDYKEKTQEELDLSKQENDLIQEYNTLSTSLDKYTCVVNGETYTYEFLLSQEADQLFEEDYDAFYQGYIDCVSAYNKDCGEIFIQLLKIRDNIAKLNGYDNYAEYADKEIYCRDYDIKELDNLKALMKEYGGYIDFYIYSFDRNVELDVSKEQLLTNTKDIMYQISEDAGKHFDIFLDEKIHSIDKSDDRYNGSYMITLSTKKAGYIFINLLGDYSDYFTLAHEFGHLYNSFYGINPNPIVGHGVYDLMEIHSSGSELLFGEKASELFGDEYDYLCSNNILEMLYSITMACIYDDWQRYIYENPDITLEEINQKFEEISLEYNFYQSEYFWIFTTHNFDSPMYYMSYGVSFYTALQIWYEAIQDFDKGAEIWENLVKSNAYEKNYFDTIEDVGLVPFNDEDYGREVIETALVYIDAVYGYYYD
ncbi:MAG: hypothetical protein Q4E33_02930 [Erysipelotrichaceae bacterium]|nr:hypothetical protein [Erysipelotrichaceae bacterium]